MPRKNKGMWYEVHPTPVKGEDGKSLVYVRPKSGLKLTMKELEDYCERWNMLRYGELSRAFDAFIRAAGRYLAEGYRIETPIGSFAPKLSLTKQITDPDQVKDRDVRLEGVEYNPGKLWDRAIEAWDEGKRQEYLQTLRYSLDVLRRRAALNGFRAGIIAYLLEGRQETERAIKFALWYAERCLHYQLQLYGSKIDALHDNAVSPQVSKGNIRYLDALPKEFTKEDLVNLRLANNESPVVKTVICRWVKEGLIMKIGTNLWQKIN